jgi:hypothetical protein
MGHEPPPVVGLVPAGVMIFEMPTALPHCDAVQHWPHVPSAQQ